MDYVEHSDIEMMPRVFAYIWVDEMKAGDRNPLLLYTQQGVSQPDTCDNLSDNDFILAMQTPLQAQMLT